MILTTDPLNMSEVPQLETFVVPSSYIPYCLASKIIELVSSYRLISESPVLLTSSTNLPRIDNILNSAF